MSSEEDVTQLHHELDDILEWQDSTSEAATDLESTSFMAFMAAGGGG